jgi:hypothetical protein
MAIGMPSMGGQRLAGLPARGAGVGRFTRARFVDRREGLHHRLARRHGLEAALEIGTRRVAAVGESASWRRER